MTKIEIYLGDGLYASYDGFALWLRAPRERDDHVVALEPDVLLRFIEFALSIDRHGKIIRRAVNDIRAREAEQASYGAVESGGEAPPIMVRTDE